MKKEFIATKINHNATYESIEIDIQEEEITFLMVRKLNSGKIIYNQIVIDKDEIKEFLEEAL